MITSQLLYVQIRTKNTNNQAHMMVNNTQNTSTQSAFTQKIARFAAITIAISALLVGCAALPNHEPNGFFGQLAHDELTQYANTTPSQPIIIKCNCISKKLTTHKGNRLILHIKGRYPKAQLNNAADNPNTHPLHFSVKEYKDYIVLESQEYARQEKIYTIDLIEIIAPANSPIHLLPTSTDDNIQ